MVDPLPYHTDDPMNNTKIEIYYHVSIHNNNDKRYNYYNYQYNKLPVIKYHGPYFHS